MSKPNTCLFNYQILLYFCLCLETSPLLGFFICLGFFGFSRKIPICPIQGKVCLKLGIIWIFFKWGCIRYLAMVIVLHTVDGGLALMLASQLKQLKEFQPPKKAPPKKLYQLKCTVQNIFTALPCRQTALSDGELKAVNLISVCALFKATRFLLTKTIILPHRTQELLVYPFPQSVSLCYCVTLVFQSSFTPNLLGSVKMNSCLFARLEWFIWAGADPKTKASRLIKVGLSLLSVDSAICSRCESK